MKKILTTILVFAVLATGAMGWMWYRDNRMPNFSGSAGLYIRPGDGPEEAVRQLREKCGIINEASLQRSFKSKEVAKYITPGYYTVNESNSSVYVARMLNNGWQTAVSLTLSGTLRNRGTIASKIAKQLLIDSTAMRNAMEDRQLLDKYGVSPETVFSLFMPNTYELYWTASAEDILDKQKQAADAFWTEERLEKAASLGLNRAEVSTLASIVNAESNYVPEYPLIAGVYLNRLAIGMLLQADPTVAFCYDYKPERILRKHLEIDSPYNTYRYSGLPPAPICVPSKEALDAVLNPDFGGVRGKGNLYFCANADFSGKHIFAKTLSQHNANARAFQAELSRRARAKRAK